MIILLIVVISTGIEYFKDPIDSTIIKSFSLISNGKKVFSYSNREGQMLCLNGLRVISLFWIILLHEFSIFAAGPIDNLREFELVSI